MLNFRRDSSLALFALFGVAVLWCALLTACVQDPRPEPSAERRLSTTSALKTPTTPLVRSDLNTQADFDELETKLLRRMGVRELIAVYTQLAEGKDVATDASAILLLQRLALLHLKLGTREGGFQEAFSIADRLRQEAPKSPHTEFLIGAITALLLPNAADGSFEVSTRRADVARRLVQHWERLLAVAPDYVGPAERGAAQVRKDLEALKAALAKVPFPAKGGDDLKVDEPNGETGGAEGPPKVDGGVAAGDAVDAAVDAKPAEPVPVSPVAVSTGSDADVATAQQDLHRLDTGDTMARRVLCRDRTERPLEPEKTTHDVVRWVELRCAIELDAPSRAMRWLTTLVTSGAAKNPCRWARRIVGGDAASLEAFGAALTARGLAQCPTP